MIHLQKGSVFSICTKISLQSSVTGESAFTLVISCHDNDGMSAGGIVSTNVFVLLWMQVAVLSGVDATAILKRILAATGVLGTLINRTRQLLPCFLHPISIQM